MCVRVKRRAIVLLCLTALAAGGCTTHTQSQTTATTQLVRNPSSFPVYQPASVVTVVAVDSRQMVTAMRHADPKGSVPDNYAGHEIILSTPASMAQLNGWVAGLRAHPPQGLHLSEDQVDVGTDAHGTRNASVADGVTFDAHKRQVWVIAADPKAVRARIGPLLDLIGSYQKVPGLLRGPIDDEAKKQVGYTVSEMLDPASPVGAALNALKRLEGTNQRAIVLLDTTQLQ